MRAVMLLAMGGVAFAGCAADSKSALMNEAATLVVVGMPRAVALAHVERAGFQCDPSAGGVTCSRSRNEKAVTTCVQRINLAFDLAKSVTSSIDVPKPACFGGFG